jgi:twitching motility protein PilT
MIEFFPSGKQQQVRSILAGVLRGVVSQRLLPALGGGRVAAVEVMVTNARIADLIREDKPELIGQAIAKGTFFQMQALTEALIDHVVAGRVDREIAANAAINKHDFVVSLEHALKRQAAGLGAHDEDVPVTEDAADPFADGFRGQLASRSTEL